MACVAIGGSREYPEAILCDVVGHDSINNFAGFPAQQLMGRNSRENGSGSMNELKKREHSWSTMNSIQRGWSAEGSEGKATGKFLRLERV